MRLVLIFVWILISSCSSVPMNLQNISQFSAWDFITSFKTEIQNKDDILKHLGDPKYKTSDKAGAFIWIFVDKNGNQRFNVRFDSSEKNLLNLTYFPSKDDETEFSKQSLVKHLSLRDCSEREEIKTIKDVTLVRNHFECKDGVTAIFDSNSVLSVTVEK